MNHNPFIIRGMIKTKKSFWGRKTDLRSIYSYLLDSEDQPQSVALVGQRRIGKSSLLYRIFKKEMADEMYDDQLKRTICLMISMQGLTSSTSNTFFGKLLDGLRDQSDDLNNYIERLKLAIPNDNEKCFEQVLRKIDKDATTLVLLLDEFEEASRNSMFDRDFFNKLRSFTQERPFAFVVSVQTDLDKMWNKELISSPYSSPFFNVFQTHTLRGFHDQIEVQEYLYTFSKNAGQSFSSTEIELIQEFGGNHPFFINIAAYHVFEAKSKDKIDNVRDNILLDPAIYGNFSYYWKKLSNLQRQTLIELDNGSENSQLSPEFKAELDRLERMSLIVKENSKVYKPFSVEFANYVKNSNFHLESTLHSINFPFNQEIEDLIAADESTELEFKSSLRWDHQQSRVNKELEFVVLKTISAFLNTNGGTLLIGVDDNNNTVGIMEDFQCLPNPKKRNKDGFQLHLLSLIKNEIGNENCVFIKIAFPNIHLTTICKITVSPSPNPVYLGKESKFFIRTGNSTTEVTKPSEVIKYYKNHWGK